MTVDVHPDRAVRSRLDSLTPLVQSRKRKLRELYAVAQYAIHGRPIQLSFDPNSTTPSDAAESRFLENNNIVQHQRPFDETTLPRRSRDANRAIDIPVKKEGGLLSAASTVKRSRSPLRRLVDVTAGANSPLSRLEGYAITPRISHPTNGGSAISSPSKYGAAFANSPSGLDRSRNLADRQLSHLNIANGETTSIQHAKTPVTPSLSSAHSLPTPTPSTATSHAPMTALLPPGDLDDDLPASPGSSNAEDSKSTNSSQAHAATSTSSVEDGQPSTLGRHYATKDRRSHGALISPEEETTDMRGSRPNARHAPANPRGDTMKIDEDDSMADASSHAEVNDSSLMEIDGEDAKPQRRTEATRQSPAHNKLTLSTTDLKSQDHGAANETPTTAVFGGRMRSASTSKSGPPPTPTERRMTRVASGAIRHKSVSEILGEPLKPSTSPTVSDRLGHDSAVGASARTDASLSPLLAQQRLSELRDKSKLSNVFTRNGSHAMQRSGSRNASQHKNPARDPIAENRDYFEVLFEAQASSHPLDTLLATAHKTISTENHYVNLHEMQDMRILRRIHSMQTTGRWSFRQIERAVEPPRKATHWDMLLDEMKWMRTDFREEKKWKVVSAKLLADACAEWVSASPAQRINLQVRVAPIKADAKMETEIPETSDQPTPDLTHSADGESVRDPEELPETGYDSVPPAAIFSLPGDEVVFEMRETPSSKDMLDNLPMYEPFKIAKASDADFCWRSAAVPVSKYVQGKMVVREPEPPKKRCRFNYDEDLDYQDLPTKRSKSASDGDAPELSRKDTLPLPSEQQDVALFNPKYQQIRDRYRSLHSYKIPSDSMMPPVQFFEHRAPSQWTWTEDEELKRLSKEFGYNWPLIADGISNKSEYASGAERRTPWECFERWVSLEGLPPDMQRTALLRTFYARLDVPAKGNAAQMLQASQFTVAGGSENVMRRRNTQSFRVDKRKNNRHMAMFEAMRKLAKKRETQLQKQQQAAGIAAMRKVAEPQLTRRPNPLEYSRRKFEREQQLEARLKDQSPAVYQQLIAQQQRAAMLQRAQGGQPNGANGRPNATANGNGQQPATAGSPVLGAAAGANPGQPRPSSAQSQPGNSAAAPMNQSPVSAVGSVDDQLKNGKRANTTGALPFNNLPAGAIPANANFDRAKLQMHLQLENQRIQMQQRNLQQQQKAQATAQTQPLNGNQAHPGGQSPQSLNAMNMTAFSNNPALFNAAMQQQLAANAAALQSSLNGGTNGSPTIANRALYQSQLAASNQQQINNINRLMQVTKSLQQRFPHATAANISAMAQRTISDMAQARMNQALSSASGGGKSPQLTPQQLAMLNGNAAQLAAAAAAGGAGAGAGVGPNGAAANPQAQAQYLFRLKQQQQQQQAQQAQRAAQAAASNGGISRTGTPQNASSSSPRISGQGQGQQGIQANASPS